MRVAHFLCKPRVPGLQRFILVRLDTDNLKSFMETLDLGIEPEELSGACNDSPSNNHRHAAARHPVEAALAAGDYPPFPASLESRDLPIQNRIFLPGFPSRHIHVSH